MTARVPAPSSDPLAAELAATLHGSPAAQRIRAKLPERHRRWHEIVGNLLAARLRELLGDDPADFLLGCYARVDELHAAAEATLRDPAATEHVVLAEHTLTSEHPIAVEVVIDGVPACTIECVLVAAFTVPDLVATVHAGRLVAADLGPAVLRLGVRVEDVELPGLERHLAPRLGRRLRPGIPLLPPGAFARVTK